MVLLALSPCLIKAWLDPRPRMITRWVSYAYMCGFLFGWHVHEKASLHFVIPLAIVAVQSLDDARHYFMLSIGTSCSLAYIIHMDLYYSEASCFKGYLLQCAYYLVYTFVLDDVDMATCISSFSFLL